MTVIEIRPLLPADRPAWAPLWAGYLTFYQTAVPATTTDEHRRRFHVPAVPMHALGAFATSRLVGIVHSLFYVSCWTTGSYGYLQDRFTAPEIERGSRIAIWPLSGVPFAICWEHLYKLG